MNYKIKNAPRYRFPVKWIFPNPESYAVSAFRRPNFETGYHYQCFYELTLITGGSGYHYIGEERILAEVGDLFVIPPGVRHAFGGGADVHHFHFAPSFFDRFMSLFCKCEGFLTLFEAHSPSGKLTVRPDLEYRLIHLENEAYDHIYHAWESLADYTVANRFSDGFVAECGAAALIRLICTEYAKTPESRVPRQDAADPFSRSILLIKENSGTPTIDELARVAGMSRTAYVKRFRRELGTSPRQFILRDRLRTARRLLISTDMPVVAVSEECGFFDLSHFVKAFRRECGMSPTEYRRRRKSGE